MSLPKKKVTNASDQATLSSVKKEMAEPRIAKSARKGERLRSERTASPE